MSEEEKRRKYMDAIEKRAKETPEIRRTIEEAKSRKVYLTKEPPPEKDKKKE